MLEAKLLSIVICTYNRVDSVKVVLYELVEQLRNVSVDGIELVIVDNNSTDSTARALKVFQAEHPELDIRYCLELEQGSSAARNRGIREAQGNLLVFLDDDIHLDPQWLHELYRLAQVKPSDFVAGARVVPLWAAPLPKWLRIEPPFEIIQSCFPAHDYGSEEQIYPFVYGKRKVQNPISACFAASRDIFENYGNFRLDLGIHGKERGACEDTELFWRVAAAGIEIKYLPKICIKHPIPAERMSQDFVLAWYELLGKTLQYMLENKLVHNQPGAKAPYRLALVVRLATYYTVFNLSRVCCNPAMSFWLRCQIAKAKGQLR